MYEDAQKSPQLAWSCRESARVRYPPGARRCGREPDPKEPFLFDPAEDEPIAASAADRTLQIVSAAMLCNVDAGVVLDYLGLNQIH